MNPVFTGAVGSATALSAPSAVAVNGEGDLYIADFNLGEVIVVPTTTGIAPYVLKTGSVQLQHPISLALDELGDLYIGDAGVDGDNATSAAPGFVVRCLTMLRPSRYPSMASRSSFPRPSRSIASTAIC